MEKETEKKELLQGKNRPAKRNTKNRKKQRRTKEAKEEVAEKKLTSAPKRAKTGHRRPPIIVPKVQEPLVLCHLCGKPIDAIAQAIKGPEVDTFIHFDCVLRQISEEERILPHQKVSYIGRGVFAIVETNSEGQIEFVKRIPYETPERFQEMQRYVEERKR